MFLINFLFVTLKILFLIQESYQYCFEVSPPENGKIHMSVDYSYYQVACDPGYTIKGDQVVLCEEDKWNKPIPTCVKAVCETLTDPINGRVECDEGLLYPGKKCTFSCFEGYKLRGVSTKRCLPTLVWSGPHTLCLPNSGVFCDAPPPLQNGKIIGCSPTESIGEYHKCHFICNGGYTLNGPSEMTCRYNGKLTDNKGMEDLPVCSRGTDKVSYGPMVTRDNSRIPKRTKSSSSQSLTQTDSDNVCSNLQCQQLCLFIDGQTQCKCEKGYKLNLDKRTCRVNKPCNINNGGCHQTQLCIEKENKTVECRRKGTQLPGSRYTTHNERRYPETASGPETPTMQTCEDGNGGCEHECYRTSLTEVNCYCKPGYHLHSDGKHCIGKDRQLPGSRYTTHNERRYPETASGPETPTTQTCEDGNGGCEHECYRTSLREVNCYCKPGYQLHSDSKHCIDIDECSNENLNKCQHECHNNEGSYTCSCRLGYVLYDNHKCKGCRKNSYWSDEFKGCVDCPRNSHTKSEGKTTIEDCICNPGFTGNPGAHVTCEDIDECHENKYGCSGKCVNILGGAYCTCPSGFTLDSDNKTCIDIDECRIKNGGCEGLCINQNGSFICICPNGYKTSDKDPYLCDDVDECLQNNGGCEQNCVNYRGGFHCACDSGYRLDMDLKSCNEIQCPRLPLPNYSNMKCQKGMTSYSETDYYPIDTICTVTCLKGYKLKDSNQMKCLKDGSWKGTLPECKTQYCSPLPIPDNGRIHPVSCSKKGAAVKQRCTFICKPGYEIEGQQIFNCKNNLTWNGEAPPICKPVEVQPSIQCPEDIYVTLSLGKAKHNVTVPNPTANTDMLEVSPSWIIVGENQEFSVGTTKITFIALSSTTNDTAECVTTVTVMDKEPPIFDYCPDPIKIEGASGEGEFVTWNEPIVKDNVELVSVFSIMKPNITLTPGTYFVEYIAKDSSGNTASCSFGINIIRMKCSRLADPSHGEANCMDLKFGSMCIPQCDSGYMQDPDAPDFYSCDDSGIWEPSDVVSECLQFSPTNSSVCEDGFELKINNENGEEFCIECPSGTAWSSASRKCEEIMK